MARTGEYGVTGVRQNAGYINEEWDRRLRSIRNKRSTMQEMQDDPTIAACLRAIDALARSSEYQLDPAEGAPDEVLPFVEDCIARMDGSWGDKLSEILSMIPYGFSLFEVVYVKRDDGKVGWLKWAPRGQETIDKWDYDKDGRDWIAAVQTNPNNGHQYVLPRGYLLHFVTTSRKQSPEGQSLIRAAFDPWYMRKHIQRIEGIGIERDMSGVPMLKVPARDYENDTKKAAWLDALSALRVNEAAGILLPSDVDSVSGTPLYEFSLVSTGGSRPIDTDKIVDRYTRSIMRNLLVDWLMLGDEGGGSFALGVSKAEVFASFVQSLLDTIADTINEQAIKPLVVANGWTEADAPVFRFETLIKRDVAAIVEGLVKLIGAGVVQPGAPEVQTLGYELMGLPIPDGGFDEAADDALLDAVIGPDPTDPAAIPETVDAPDDQTFTEPINDDLLTRSREAFMLTVPDALAGLLDAKVEVGA